jgi:hypothetical protein
MDTFAAIMAAWPTDADFARDIGIRPNHGQVMKARGSIPPGYWPDVVRAAEARRIEGVTIERLADIAAARRRGRQEQHEAAA